MSTDGREPNGPSPIRPVGLDVRSRIIAGSVLMAGSLAAITAVIVIFTLNRHPMYGLWPIAIGVVVTGVGILWAWWYARHRFYYARHGVSSVAYVVAVRGGGRAPRIITFEYAYEGRLLKSTKDDSLYAFREGSALAILIDPRNPTNWIRWDEIFYDRQGKHGDVK